MPVTAAEAHIVQGRFQLSCSVKEVVIANVATKRNFAALQITDDACSNDRSPFREKIKSVSVPHRGYMIASRRTTPPLAGETGYMMPPDKEGQVNSLSDVLNLQNLTQKPGYWLIFSAQ